MENTAIPMGRNIVDFHSHILPQMDDGSRNAEESLLMLRESAKQGISIMAATPHFYAEENTIDRFLERRKEAWDRLSVQIELGMPTVLLGAEVHYYEGMQQTKEISLLRIMGTNLLVLEMPFTRWTDRMIAEIIGLNRRSDIRVMLAHIERYLRFQRRSVWTTLLENGILMQANASFFLGRLSKYQALHMVKKGQVHLLGSDCHNMTSRPPKLGEAAQLLEEHGLLKEIELRGQELLYEKGVGAG